VASDELSKLDHNKTLGLFNLKLIEFLNILSKHFGSEMKVVFRENDIYSSILPLFELFPLHDLAL